MAKGTKKVIYAALIGNLLIAATKFGAAIYTGSAAMLAEGVHSLVDTGNEGLLLYGQKRAQLPPDKLYPFGHGKEVYFWSFIVALLVFALGSGVSLFQGIAHLLHPSPVEDVWVNYTVLGLSAVFEGTSWVLALREFLKHKGQRGYLEAVETGKDPTTFTVLLEDSAALLGLAVAAIGLALVQLTGNSLYDGAASVVIGLILAAAAMLLARETKGLLIGEAASEEVVDGIRQEIQKVPDVEKVNEILTMHIGPDFILVNISLMISGNAGRSRAHEVFDYIDARIKARFPRIQRVFIESENAVQHAAPPQPAG